MVDDRENEKFILILDVKDLMSSNLSWMSDFWITNQNCMCIHSCNPIWCGSLNKNSLHNWSAKLIKLVCMYLQITLNFLLVSNQKLFA